MELDYRKSREELEKLQGNLRKAPEGIWCYELEEPLDTKLPVQAQCQWIFEKAILTHCNEALARMYGYSKVEDIIGIHLKDLFFPNIQTNLDILAEFVGNGYKTHDAESTEVDRNGNQKYFVNTSLGVVENGVLLRAWGVQKDITAMKNSELRLKRTIGLEGLLSEISRNFLRVDPGQTHEAINFALERLGEFTGADRAYIFLFTNAGLAISNSNEWCADGIPRQMHRLQNLPITVFPMENLEALRKTGVFVYNSADEIPENHTVLREFFQSMGLKSSIVVGLVSVDSEIGFLGLDSISKVRTWTEEDGYVLRLVADLVVLALDRKKRESDLNDFYERMNHDLELARITQRSLVAREFPDSPFFQVVSYFRPFEKVGGDIITYVQHESGVIDILFGDVSGHGISSAMVSGMAVLSFKYHARSGLSPAKGIQEFIKDLKPMVVEHHIATVWVRFFPLEKKLLYCYAGHPPIILFRGDQMIELKGMNLPLLIFDSIDYFDESLDLQAGDRLVFYSDGMYEVFNKQGRILDLSAFQEILNSYRELNSLQEYIEQVIADVFQFSEGTFSDDMAMLVIDIKK
ncbi:serine/threonine protein phosphatase [Leptospira perolatii]|uniref:Serine/threonine protein phosphatase n=1 Tax=Leptospira perolatii TaxID=2023191 RepID=A0A2M9ZND1_9LEPT|nr:SpoIIE family protein phosphatase [Leptospira perolatii]PJZ69593.1 serine/threonine protein phosphatase [Leptospira perolatii]PJZ73580.1 serine/threonine protein phosphatase [Leptospira perolatii]